MTKPFLLLVKQPSALFLLERRIDRRLRLEKGRAWSLVIVERVKFVVGHGAFTLDLEVKKWTG